MAALHGQAFVNPRPWSEAEIAALMDSPLCFALVKEGGFLIGRAVAGEAELLTVAVDPARQGQGIGKSLVRQFVSEARARGADSAFLEVAADNVPAIAVYRKAGFVEQGRRRGYYGGIDAVMMACDMTDRVAFPPNP